MPNEKKTDIFISKRLESAKIKYTPNCSDIKEVQEALKTASKKGAGKSGFPEFTAISKDFIIVIENKSELEKQVLYCDDNNQIISTDQKAITNYAENGALHYAKEISAKTNFKKIFAFGCSGDEKHHIIRPIFVDENGYKLLEKVENFENFSDENIGKYYSEQVLGETPQETLELEAILNKSKDLHEALRNYGSLGDKEKPLIVSALLLALQEPSFNIDSLTGDKIKTDGQKIFDSLSTFMEKVEVKPESKKQQVLTSFTIVKNSIALNEIDERLAKTPIRYFAEYIKNNVNSKILTTSTEDILGRFYGEFMRYTGGDGQSLGIVLTPKHITELFTELVEIKPTDLVFDPCCGTGGFLVAAMQKMIDKAGSEQEKTKIKKDRIHGIEVSPEMFAIATTNMILRGDGKSNLDFSNFLKQSSEKLKEKKYTVGFINPPYSQAKGKDTAHLSEINFIKHLLDSLEDGGRCVAIVPQSTMVGKTKEDKAIKKQILEKHTLEGVITLNKNTFYGVGTNPCIAVFTSHKPHSNKKYCKFVNYEDDGFVVSKHIGLVETTRAISQKALLLDCWLHNKRAETKFMVETTIEPEDEWLHSFYYFNDEIPKEEDFEKTIADYLTFEFSMIMQGREYLFENKAENIYLKTNKAMEMDLKNIRWGEFLVKELFKIERGNRLTKSNRVKGDIPLVTAGFQNVGVAELIKNKEQQSYSNAITIDMFGNVFYRGYEFKCDDNIHVLTNKNISKANGDFIGNCFKQATKNIFSYGKQFRLKTLEKLKIILPITQKGEPDYAFMEQFMRQKEQGKIKKFQNYIAKRIE